MTGEAGGSGGGVLRGPSRLCQRAPRPHSAPAGPPRAAHTAGPPARTPGQPGGLRCRVGLVCGALLGPIQGDVVTKGLSETLRCGECPSHLSCVALVGGLPWAHQRVVGGVGGTPCPGHGVAVRFGRKALKHRPCLGLAQRLLRQLTPVTTVSQSVSVCLLPLGLSTGRFGACFIPGLCKQSDLTLYASRPGLRLWKADVHGTVQATFILKDAFAAGAKPFELYPRLEPFGGGGGAPEKHLGLVSCFFQEGWVLSWNEYSIYLLDTVNQVRDRTTARPGVPGLPGGYL